MKRREDAFQDSQVIGMIIGVAIGLALGTFLGYAALTTAVGN